MTTVFQILRYRYRNDPNYVTICVIFNFVYVYPYPPKCSLLSSTNDNAILGVFFLLFLLDD